MATFLPVTMTTPLETGDILAVDSFVPWVTHFAMVFSKSGRQFVVENKFLTGNLGIEALEDYRKRRNITSYLRDEKTKALTDALILKKAEECKKIGYRFFHFNCEDFVKHISGTEIGYDQRIKWGLAILGVIAGGFAGWFLFKKWFKNKEHAKWWGALIGAGLLAGAFISIREVRKVKA